MNKSRHFLPQLIGINQYTAGFIDCFLGDLSEEMDFNHIYILMDKDSSLLDLYPETISKREVEKGFLYKIAVLPKYVGDLEKFYQGKYSEMSDEAKQVMIEFSGQLPDNNICYHVLYKTKKRKEFIEETIGMELPEGLEYMSILDLSKEIYED